MLSVLVTAASVDLALGRRTWEGNRYRFALGLDCGALELQVEAPVLVHGLPDRWLPGAIRSARVRCCRSGIARSRHHVRPAMPWHRSARCRPRPPTREATCPRWRPIGQPPFLSRTWTPPHGEVVSGMPRNASHY